MWVFVVFYDHGIWSHHFMANRWGNSEKLCYIFGLQNHCRWQLQPWNLKTLATWKKIYTKFDNILKSRDITLPTKVHLVKAMVFLVGIYGCESWTIKKAELQRIDAFELWFWRRLLRVPRTARRSKQSILKTVLNIHWKDWCWSWNSNTLAIWCKELTPWKRPCCWEWLKAGGEEGNRGWDGWMASLTQWTWVWANSGWWWRTGKPGVLQSVGLKESDTTEAT